MKWDRSSCLETRWTGILADWNLTVTMTLLRITQIITITAIMTIQIITPMRALMLIVLPLPVLSTMVTLILIVVWSVERTGSK